MCDFDNRGNFYKSESDQIVIFSLVLYTKSYRLSISGAGVQQKKERSGINNTTKYE